MSKLNTKNILLAITNAYWFIDIQSAEQLGHNVAAVLAGKDFWTDKHKANAEFTIVTPGADSFISNSLSAAKEGSIAIINIDGPIMKYDNCGDPGSQTLESLIKQADSNPNIKGLILKISSGGGEVSGTHSLATTFKNFSKAKVTLFEDLGASAAYWIGVNGDYLFADTETAMIGSIGGMASFKDMRPLWKAQGINVHEIYATDSTEKNIEYQEALKGNYKPFQKNILNPMNKVFSDWVKTSRGEKLDIENTLNGQIHIASQAIKFGLIDEIGGLDAAINKINELADGTQTPPASANLQANTQTPNNMKKITLLASHAALLALCGVTIEAGAESADVELTDDVLTNINAALVAANKAKTDLTAVTEKLKTAETSVTDLKAKLDVSEAKIRSLETAGDSKAKTEKDDVIEVDETQAIIDALPHNQAVDKNPMFKK